MSRRKPGMATRPDRETSDYYPTPPEITRALLERETFPGSILEPACGSGELSEELLSAGYDVHSSDLHDRGYGETGSNFLHISELPGGVESIVTNPPFKLAREFVLHSLRLRPRKIALFARLALLEGGRRYREIFAEHPPSRVWVFSKRVTLYPAGSQGGRRESGYMAFAWYVWEPMTFRGADPATRLHWIYEES